MTLEYRDVRVLRRFQVSAAHRVGDDPLHGHNFVFELTLAGAPNPTSGELVEGPDLLRVERWIESAFDRAVILKEHDPLAAPLQLAGQRVVLLSAAPTAETLAQLGYLAAHKLLLDVPVRVASLRVSDSPEQWSEVCAVDIDHGTPSIVAYARS